MFSRANALSARETLSRQFRANYRGIASKNSIVVAVLHNWGDFELTLSHLTPNADGVWGNVSFVSYGTVRQPDFVLVLNTIKTPIKLLKIAPERLWFASSEGPNAIHAVWQAGQGRKSTVITSARETHVNEKGRSYIQSPPITPSWWVHKSYDELLNTHEVPKTRNLSWITSNFTNLDGHRIRMAFLERLKIQNVFDLFGRGFSSIADKWDGLAPYRYSIAFENTIAPHYFTEKLMDCFVSHTLPLYFGAPNIGKYFPEKAVIKIDPDDPDVFQKIEEISSSDLWKERLPYVLEAKELVLKKYNMYARLAGLMGKAAERDKSAKKWIMLRSHKLRF